MVTSDEILMNIESDGDVADVIAAANRSSRRSSCIRIVSQRLSESQENDITQCERRRYNQERLLNSRITSAQFYCTPLIPV